MNNNKEYANLLEMYAKLIRKADYGLSQEQKELIQNLGDTLIERKEDIETKAKYNKKRVSCKTNSRKVLESSSFELKMKNRTEQKRKQKLGNSNMELAKEDIGKEPGE